MDLLINLGANISHPHEIFSNKKIIIIITPKHLMKRTIYSSSLSAIGQATHEISGSHLIP